MPTTEESDNLRERLAVVKDLIAVFRFERLVYLAIIMISFTALMISVVMLIVNGRASVMQISMLFGSGGAISYTGARLLKMWGDALHFLLPVIHEKVK